MLALSIIHFINTSGRKTWGQGWQDGGADTASPFHSPSSLSREQSFPGSFSSPAVLEALVGAIGSNLSAYCQEQGLGRGALLRSLWDREEQRVLSKEHLCPHPGGPTLSLAHLFPDRMRSHRKERGEPGLSSGGPCT